MPDTGTVFAPRLCAAANRKPANLPGADLTDRGRTLRTQGMKKDWKRTFAIIWSGQFFSILSSAVVGYAVVFWLSLETGSAEILATAAIASLLPQSLLGFFVGVYIDPASAP